MWRNCGRADMDGRLGPRVLTQCLRLTPRQQPGMQRAPFQLLADIYCSLLLKFHRAGAHGYAAEQGGTGFGIGRRSQQRGAAFEDDAYRGVDEQLA